MKIREYYLAHPNGPYVYSEWSDIPDDERLREKWFEYLKLYKPMVSEDSQCFIDIAPDNDITATPFISDVHMSVFVNDECYLCISNLGGADSKIAFKESWLNRVTGEIVTETEIPAGGMVFLKKI